MRTRRITVSFLLTVATAVGTLLGVAGQAAPAAAATKSTVVIGDLCSCTGPEASTISQTTATMQAWASWVNSHGGLAGHPVKLVVQDDNYSPVQAIAAANTLIDSDHVIAIFDNSDEDPSWGPVAQKADVPVLGGQETDSGWQNADFYPAGASFNYRLWFLLLALPWLLPTAARWARIALASFFVLLFASAVWWVPLVWVAQAASWVLFAALTVLLASCATSWLRRIRATF